jgi:hypothetical protein
MPRTAGTLASRLTEAGDGHADDISGCGRPASCDHRNGRGEDTASSHSD